MQLYEATHQQAYLRTARKYIAWADAHSWNAARGLYQRNEHDDTVLNYVEGMMIGAHAVLCRALSKNVTMPALASIEVTSSLPTERDFVSRPCRTRGTG